MIQTITFQMDGKSYSLGGDPLNVWETRLLKAKLDLGPAEIDQWLERILSMNDLDAILLLMLFAMRRSGAKVEWSDFDHLSAREVLTRFEEAMERAAAEVEAEAEAAAESEAAAKPAASDKPARAPRKPKVAKQPEPAAPVAPATQ
jgi:hypothetical protein